MYILAEVCNNPGVLRVIYFMNIILDIVFTILPIGLIVMLMIDFTKAVIATKEDEQAKSTKLVGKRIMYAVLVFMVPYFVQLVLLFLDEVEVLNDGKIVFEYNDCLKNANSKQIDYFQKIEDEKEKREKEEKRQNSGNAGNSGNGFTVVSKDYREAAQNMLKLAKGELGHKGGSKYSGLSDSTPWCAFFVIWNLENTKIEGKGTVLDVIQKEGNVVSRGLAGGTIYNFYHSKNLEFYYSKNYGGNYIPKRGDIIYFYYGKWDKVISDRGSHVGLVDYVSSGKVCTVEGNTGGQGSANNYVGQYCYDLNSADIMGYGSWYNSFSHNSSNKDDLLY